MNKAFLLAVILFLHLSILILPPAYALNCSKFDGDERALCGIVKPFPIAESTKDTFMKRDLFGQAQPIDRNIKINLNLENNKQITLNDIYQDKIIFIIKLSTFILINYFIFSILNKSSFLTKWLNADY